MSLHLPCYAGMSFTKSARECLLSARPSVGSASRILPCKTLIGTPISTEFHRLTCSVVGPPLTCRREAGVCRVIASRCYPVVDESCIFLCYDRRYGTHIFTWKPTPRNRVFRSFLANQAPLRPRLVQSWTVLGTCRSHTRSLIAARGVFQSCISFDRP